MKYLKNNIGIVVVILGIVALLIYNFTNSITKTEKAVSEYSEVLITTETANEIDIDSYIMVDIKGEVNYPGLYQAKANMRLGDILGVAGGVTESADLSNINLAMKLYDEMNITIPKKIIEHQIPNDIVKIQVEIKGEVHLPGVYTLYPNSRVEDLIEEAGGLTDLAEIDHISRARILEDGEMIIIPKISIETTTEINTSIREIYVEICGEIINPGVYLVPENYSVQDLIYAAGGVTTSCNLEAINWEITLCLGASIYIPSYEDEYIEEIIESDKVNINTANLEELIKLTGIGQILGQRIIDYRAEFGNFLCIEDIMNVSGIKFSIYEEIKESITV